MYPTHSRRPLLFPPIDNLLKGVKILIVEDHPGFAELMKDILEQHGARTRIVSNAPAAFPLIDSSRFDLITTGMNMSGGINGLEFIRHLKARAGFMTPVLMCTACCQKK